MGGGQAARRDGRRERGTGVLQWMRHPRMIAHSNRWDNLYLLLQALPIMMLVPITQMSHSTRTHNVRVTSSIWQKLEPYKLAQRLLSASNKFYTLVPQVLSWPLHTLARACFEDSQTEDRLNCGCPHLSECCVYDKRRLLDIYICAYPSRTSCSQLFCVPDLPRAGLRTKRYVECSSH